MNRIFDRILHSWVDDYYLRYPGLLRRQSQSTGLDLFSEIEYNSRFYEAISQKQKLDRMDI